MDDTDLTLTSLHANYREGCLWMDCPCKKKEHRIHLFTDECKGIVPSSERKFVVVGKFPNLTIHPALLSECASFSIIDGVIKGLVT
jgi:hypothetical protein